MLDELGALGFPKTSGGNGLHVYVRVEPRWEFTDVRRAALAFARAIGKQPVTAADRPGFIVNRILCVMLNEAIVAVAERLTMMTGAFADLLNNSDSPLELIVGIAVEVRNRILGDPLLRVLAVGGGTDPVSDPGAAARTHEYCMALLAPAAERFPAAAEGVR